MTIEWKNDFVTRMWLRENDYDLENPASMTPFELGDASTYCKTMNNPFTIELMRRSGDLEKFTIAQNDAKRREILDRSCRYHGFTLV